MAPIELERQTSKEKIQYQQTKTQNLSTGRLAKSEQKPHDETAL